MIRKQICKVALLLVTGMLLTAGLIAFVAVFRSSGTVVEKQCRASFVVHQPNRTFSKFLRGPKDTV